MGRSPYGVDTGLKKGPWTPEEDQRLISYIQKHGHGSWRALPKLAGLNRCGKSCRLRWTNYLRPDIKRGKFSSEEEQTILNLHSVLGNKWSAIATHLPGRTDNEIKNFWNTHLKKKLIQMGFDPMTHRPRTDIMKNLPHLIALANLKELMGNQQCGDPTVRLQSEAIQMARLQYLLQTTGNMPASTSSIDGPSSNIVTPNEIELNNSSLLTTQVSNVSPSSMQTQFQRLSEFQIPCTLNQPMSNTETNQDSSTLTVFSQGEEDYNNRFDQITLVSPNSSLPPLTDFSTGISPGDACSTNSSYGGSGISSCWSDHLFINVDDSFISEFA